VEVAPDAAPLRVGGFDHPRPGCGERRGLVAPLELGARAGGEDPQRGDVPPPRPPCGGCRARPDGRGARCPSRAGRPRGSSRARARSPRDPPGTS
jgi:hypothetical protein